MSVLTYISFSGNVNQPKWGHLKQLHTVLKSMEKPLTYGNISRIDLGNSIKVSPVSLDYKLTLSLTNPLVVPFKRRQFTQQTRDQAALSVM